VDRDFSQPQRESALGIIVMAVHTIIKVTKAMFFFLIYAFIKMGGAYSGYTLLGVGIVLLFCLIYAYFSYLKFTFFLDKDKQEFVVNKGIFNRDQIIIQLDKIQQVNINQSILQKIIGVYGLKIDTAGAKGEEVSIRAIDEVSAYNLKDHLLSSRIETAGQILEDAIQDQPAGILKISSWTLFKVGLTSNYGKSLALITAFLLYVIQEARHIMEVFHINKDIVKSTFLSFATIFSLAIIVAVLLVAFLVFNVVRTFYKYFELEIIRHKHSLLLSSGLIAKKNTLISPNKVQVTAYSQNYFQKKLDMLNMRLKQAHFGGNKKDEEMQGSTLEIVGCNPTERDELLKMVLGKVPLKGKIFIPDWRFLNLPVFFKLILPVVIFLLAAFKIPEIKPFIGFAAAYFVIGFLMIFISYRKHRLSVNQEFVIKTSGIWDISNEILVPSKIQAITTSQYPWHRSIDVGHLCLHTAAGEIRFKYGNYSEIKQLVNYWLYQVESSEKNWM
jgi:putative membrane protein